MAEKAPFELTVQSARGEAVGRMQVPRAALGGAKGIVRRRLIRDAVIHYEANLRQGTSATKTKGLVAGSKKKPWKQKGTGRARCGAKQSPLWRGGGVVFGPQPREYRQRFNARARKAATRGAVLAKFADQQVRVIDELGLARPRTRELVQTLAKLGLGGAPVLIVLPARDENVLLSGRNIPRVSVTSYDQLNAREVLRHEFLLFTQAALQALLGG